MTRRKAGGGMHTMRLGLAVLIAGGFAAAALGAEIHDAAKLGDVG